MKRRSLPCTARHQQGPAAGPQHSLYWTRCYLWSRCRANRWLALNQVLYSILINRVRTYAQKFGQSEGILCSIFLRDSLRYHSMIYISDEASGCERRQKDEPRGSVSFPHACCRADVLRFLTTKPGKQGSFVHVCVRQSFQCLNPRLTLGVIRWTPAYYTKSQPGGPCCIYRAL